MLIHKQTKTMIGSRVPKGTSGSILFIDVNGLLAQDNSKLFWDDTNDRFAIGTPTPETKLHIVNETLGEYVATFADHTADTTGATLKLLKSRGTYASPSAVLSGDKLGAIDFYSRGASTYAESAAIDVGATQNHSETARGSYIALKTTADGTITPTTRVYVGQNGYVGINTSAPAAQVEIDSAGVTLGGINVHTEIKDTTNMAAGVGAAVVLAGNYITGSPTTARFAAIAGIKENGTSGNYASALIFYTRANGANLTEQMRIASTGNVGINTTLPLGRIHIKDPDYTDSALFERSGQTADSMFAAARMLTTKTTDMADGFGTGFAFVIQDDAGVLNTIGSVGAVRAGADNSGSLVFHTYVAGTGTEKMRLTSAGNIGIGTTGPTGKFEVHGSSGDVSTVGLLRFQTNSGTNDVGFKMGGVAGAGSAGYLYIQGMHPGIANDGNLILNPSSGKVGFGLTVPTAVVHIKAGAAAASSAPLKFTTGTVNTTAEAGAMEYNNTPHFTNSDATRRHIVLAPNTTEVTAGAPYANSGYVVMNIGGTDFKIMTTA